MLPAVRVAEVGETSEFNLIVHRQGCGSLLYFTFGCGSQRRIAYLLPLRKLAGNAPLRLKECQTKTTPTPRRSTRSPDSERERAPPTSRESRRRSHSSPFGCRRNTMPLASVVGE